MSALFSSLHNLTDNLSIELCIHYKTGLSKYLQGGKVAPHPLIRKLVQYNLPTFISYQLTLCCPKLSLINIFKLFLPPHIKD